MSTINPALLNSASVLDPSQLDELLGPDAWKLTPATLAAKVSRGAWRPAKHLLYLSARIAYELAKGNARLIISMPPRHGKSELTSVWTPVWILNEFPNKEVMSISYGADLAEEFGQKVRDIILEDGDPEEGTGLLSVKIRKDSARVSRFKTTEGGGMRSVGLGGAVYGRGADILLLDDYYKNIEEATSEIKRKAVFDWFSTIAMSRLHKNGSAIIIATRWGVEDLSAQMLSITGTKWTEIALPAIAEEGDLLGRAVGEALWPEDYPLERLEELHQTMGTFLFNAIYQQKPKKISSKHFTREWVQIVDQLPPKHRQRKLRSWDLAGSEDKGDFTAGAKIILDTETNAIYIADFLHGQWSPGTVKQLIKDTAENDGIDTEILLEQEPGSSGKAVAEDYVKMLAGYSARAVRHTGDKFVRAQPWFAAAEFGRVFMLRAPWNDDFLDECVAFPLGEHDDRVDTVSQGYNHFFKKVARAGTWGSRVNAPEDDGAVIRGNQLMGQVVTGVTWGRGR